MRTLLGTVLGEQNDLSQLTVDEVVSYLPLFDTYITYPRGMKMSVSECLNHYDEDASVELLGIGNLSYMMYDCQVCSFISHLPVEILDAINSVFDDGMERDDFEMLQTPISAVIAMYEAHPELH